jgi:hypothetical protein
MCFYSTMGSADGTTAAGVLQLADNIVNVMTVNWGKQAQERRWNIIGSKYCLQS